MQPKPITPGPGEESVWDYPRPPRLESSRDVIRVVVNGQTVADSTATMRVLETSHPPVYYIPPSDIRTDWLRESNRRSYCEWKGKARYFDIWLPGACIANAAWSYPDPSQRFVDIKDYLAFYPSKMDACYVGDEQVKSQAGDIYGGWITSRVVGPFKGQPGSQGW